MNYQKKIRENNEIIKALQEENTQFEKKAEEAEVRVWEFLAKKQRGTAHLIFALRDPNVDCCDNTYRLPFGFRGRGAFSPEEVRRIIKGLKELIGDE